jgi:hypothetical protein
MNTNSSRSPRVRRTSALNSPSGVGSAIIITTPVSVFSKSSCPAEMRLHGSSGFLRWSVSARICSRTFVVAPFVTGALASSRSVAVTTTVHPSKFPSPPLTTAL